MPGATLPNTGIVLPTLGGDSGDWDDILNAALTNYDEHDHTAGNGVRITVAALDIDDDLSVDGNALEDVGKLEFQAIAALEAGAVTLYVSDVDDELYWRTNAGVNVKLTNGASINTSLVGGIGGDYSTVSAELAFDDANDRYTFKQNNATGWARLAAGSVRIYETGTSETVYVGINTPAALAASYDITLPAALPAAQAIMQLSAAGVVTASNVLAAGESVTVSTTGDYKHGEKKWIVPFGTNTQTTIGTLVFGAFGTGAYAWQLSAGGLSIMYVPGLRTGWRIKAVSFVYNSAGTPTPGLAIQQYDGNAAMSTTDTDVGGVYTMTVDGGGYTIGTTGDGPDLLRLEMTNLSVMDLTDVTVTYDIP